MKLINLEVRLDLVSFSRGDDNQDSQNSSFWRQQWTLSCRLDVY